jgi:small subunit ribosomal protein S18
MARNNDRERTTRRVPKDNGRRTKKKVCIFCKDRIEFVDYKDVNLLRKFMSDRGKIRARRVSGNCAQHQRDVATAIKMTRELALLPYTQRTTSERPGGRGGGRGGGRATGLTRAQARPAAAVATAEPAARTEGEAEAGLELAVDEFAFDGEPDGSGSSE